MMWESKVVVLFLVVVVVYRMMEEDDDDDDDYANGLGLDSIVNTHTKIFELHPSLITHVLPLLAH